MKPKVAIFDFADCEGCELQIGNCEEVLPLLLRLVDIVRFRLVHSTALDEFDEQETYNIAFVQGSITTPEARERLERIRERSTILIAMGACAISGGVQTMVPAETLERAHNGEFGECIKELDVFPPEPLSTFIQVDYSLPGCPIEKREFLAAVAALLSDGKPHLPEYSVCVECRKRENPCVVLEGGICLGMVTRGGCLARCPTRREGCRGCRGAVPGANLMALFPILEQKGLSEDDIRARLGMFNSKLMGDAK